MPAAPSSPCPRPRSASGVQCPVRATSVHACLSTGPVSSVRCGRLSVQVSAVRRPLWASGVCALPRPLCPARVRSWSAVVGRQLYGWDGRGRRGRPLRPCPARGLPESAPRARSWRRRCWASRGVGVDLAVVVGGGWAWPGRPRGRPGQGGCTRGSFVGGSRVRGEARLLRQADRHAAVESLGRSCRVEPNIKKPIGHIPLAKQK
jgi:hypothetical protein